MSAREVLRRLDDLGVTLTLADGRLRYRSRAGELPSELLAEMKEHRENLVGLVGRRERLTWPPAPGGDTGPLTAAQRSLWATSYFAEDGTYNLCGALRLRGPLQRDAFVTALRDLHARHPSLRTVFPVTDGEPRQRILPTAEPPLTLADAADLDSCLAECARLTDRPLALDTAPPVLMRLFRLAPRDHVFFFVLHHVIADGSSFGPLLDDLARCYAARVAGYEPPPLGAAVPVVDYARWEADRIAHADRAAARRYWRDRFDEASLGALPLPPPLDGADGGRGHAHRVVVPAGTTAAVRRIAERTRTGVFTVVTTAVAVALSRYTGREDLVVGMPVSRRDRTGLERVVGLLLDTVPVRLDAGPAPFADLVRRTRSAVLGAVRHAPVPEDVAAARAAFNVIVTDLGVTLPAPHFPGLAIEHVEVAQVGAKYDLNFLVRDEGDTLALYVEADRRAVADADVEAVAGTVLAVLTEAGADPAAPVTTLAAGAFGVAAPGAVAAPDRVPRADESLTGRLAVTARTRADAVAVTAPEGVLTYRELWRRVGATAGALRARGIGAGDVVAVSLPRGLDLVVAVLGVMASGAASLVLHESWPTARVTGILTDSGARLTVTDDDTVPGERVGLAALVDAPVKAPLTPVPAHAAAYVIYTSGSTGRPKGVRVTHHNVLSLLDATAGGYGLGPDDVWTLFHACSFDVSMYEMFGCLLHGGRLVVVPRLTTWEPEEFAELCARERVTVLSQTPSALTVMLPALAARPDATAHLRYVLFAGEALDRRLVERWYEEVGHRTQLVNMYGITETTVHASWRLLRPEDTRTAESDIGTPLPGTALHVLRDDGTPVADRCVGEIYVGGPQVSDGYLGRPRETALRFLPDPFSGTPGARMYRSGDLARRNGTTLAYLGRRDQQVQVNGFRVELAEIEAAFSARPGVAAAGAAVTADDSGAHLVAVVVPEAGATPEPAGLLAAVRSTLPRYMVPRTVVMVDDLPLTTNGKLDRAAVVASAAGGTPVRPAPAAPAAAPSGARETLLLEVFREVLGDPATDTGTDFFQAGGDSMRAIRVVGLAKDRGLGLTVQDVYAAPTVAALAPRATGADADRAVREPFAGLPAGVAFPPDVVDAYPMTALQSGMMYHQEMAPDARVYHIMLSYRVRGVLDPVAFRAAAQAVTDAHPVLRTSFDLANALGPVQRVHTGVAVPVAFEDLTGLDADAQAERIRQVVAHETAEDFDLSRPAPFRLVALTTSATDYQLVFTHHHAILDGWSVNVFFEDLHARYRELLDTGTAAAPRPLPRTSFGDYVALERAALADEEQGTFWSGRTARPARLIAPERSGAPVMRQFHVDLTGRLGALREAAARLGVPVKALLCAAHLRVVSWLTGSDEVATSMVFACRPEDSDADRVLGLFLNQLPLRVALGERSWAELAVRVHQEEQEMMRHRWYPSAAIQAGHGAAPLFDSGFNFTDYHTTRRMVGDGGLELLDAQELESTHYAYSSAFTVDVRTHELRLLMEYDAAALPESTMALAAEAHRRALAAIVEDAGRPLRATPLPGMADLARLLTSPRPAAPAVPPSAPAPRTPAAPPVRPSAPAPAPGSAGVDLEASVREVWTEVLGITDVDAATPFFDVGGDSLTAMQVVSRLRARHGALSMRAFMAAPTVAGLADALAGATAPTPRTAVTPVAVAPVASGTATRHPLSPAQRQMWEIAGRLPGVGLFGMAGALRADGPLEIPLLERTFAELAARHEALRTRVEASGDGPVQVVEPHVTITVDVEDLTAHEHPDRHCERLMAAASREALPLDRAPLLRVVVYRLAADRHVIFLNVHHLVCDGGSLTLLLSDASRIYREIAADGAPAPRPLPRGSGWLADDRTTWLTTDEAARQRAYWLDRLTPPWRALADTPGSRFAELGTASFAQRLRSTVTRATLSADDRSAVRAAARRHGMTDFMLVLAAYAATLRAWSGQDDIRIATMLANRVEPGLDEVVGLVANTVVLRMRLGDTDPVAISRQAREVCVAAFENQELPFEDVLAGIRDRYPDTGPVFEAMLVAQEETATVTPDEGLVFAPYRSARDVLGAQVVATASDFVLGIAPTGGELLFELRYRPATTPKELAAELLAAITTAVRTTAAALLETP
ncbi:amino acid adenylation domain-containing protein [Streptomyces sp. NBC_00582]|uniref:amino acid adenylation domain-containing protein n=1 Tax=Streptomyces sp. NBC_00582 TaxID=2975783 RepID=UPI002E8055A5|nr:amino acid adenylation domain-containing protein [Streptomyces sp. NBC_00582]WUB63933.1 amino acid adenylation domain-containing protein [Streptomyces sp. NBC_00582]